MAHVQGLFEHRPCRVQRIDVEHHDSVIDGAVFGALYVAACARWWCAQGANSPPQLPQDMWIGAGVGALVGAGLDAMLFKRTTIYKAGGSAGLQPIRGGVAISLRF